MIDDRYVYNETILEETEALKFSGICNTEYHGELITDVEIFNPPKITKNGHVIVGEIEIFRGKQPLFKNSRGVSTKVEQGFYVNIKKEQSRSSKRKIKVITVEEHYYFEDRIIEEPDDEDDDLF